MDQDDVKSYDVKEFLFKLIKKEFGYGYIPEYHQDIVNLESFYINPEKNAFILAIDAINEELVGTLGIRAYDKDFKDFEEKYNSNKTASFWRTFVSDKYRRKGLASALVNAGENFCHKQNFNEIYLHTHRTVPGSLQFWLSNGYKIIKDAQNEMGTVHMEKTIDSYKNQLSEPIKQNTFKQNNRLLVNSGASIK